MVANACEYVSRFDWCRAVREAYVGDATIGGIVAVVLVEIEPAAADVDDLFWVVVGDIPPAYIAGEGAITPADALDFYLGAMGEWVEAVKAGKPTDDLIPVTTTGGGQALEPTEEHAEMLATRLEFVARNILAPLRRS